MNYESLMVCLGKKTLKIKQAERRKQQEEQARREEFEQQKLQMGGDERMYDQHQNEGDGHGGKSSSVVPPLSSSEIQTGSSRRKGANYDTNDMVRDCLESVKLKFVQNYEGNAAMKYRAAKANPKQVEVWISKIHRNGLFACQA